MSDVTKVTIRIDEDLKKQADVLFNDLGLTMSTAINIFLRQSVREGRIPFEITTNVPNDETIEALLESKQLENNPNAKIYNLDDALKELKE